MSVVTRPSSLSHHWHSARPSQGQARLPVSANVSVGLELGAVSESTGCMTGRPWAWGPAQVNLSAASDHLEGCVMVYTTFDWYIPYAQWYIPYCIYHMARRRVYIII